MISINPGRNVTRAPDRPDLSAIIVSWNTRPLLEKCLRSLLTLPCSPDTRAFDRLEPEVIVIDNASSDGTPGSVRSRFPAVRLMVNTSNVGFARACNQGLAVGAGRYLLLLNPDTEVRQGALADLVRFMDDHPDVGAAGAALLDADGTLQVSCSRTPTLLREFWRLFHLDAFWPLSTYSPSRWVERRSQEVDVVQGACLVIRREALGQIGPLDEDYFIYSEEVDLCYRIRQAGWKVFWLPAARVVHYGGRSTQQVADAMFLRLYQSKLLFFRKHRGGLAVLIYKLIIVIASFARIGLIPLSLLEPEESRQRHMHLAGRYLQLLLALPRF